MDKRLKRSFKIVAALALSVVGMALLPLIALPYGGLDWLAYDPAYKNGYGFPSIPPETPRCPVPAPETPQIPCAEMPEPGEPLAARVNGQGIRLAAFEREVDQFLKALIELGADPESDEFQVQIPAYRRQVLNLMIDDLLIQQAALEFGITVTDEQIQARVAEAVAQGGGLEAFHAWLDETGQTWEEFSRDICQDLLRQALLAHVTAGIGDRMEMVHARQIVVATEQEAVAVLSRLASGETFEAVARQVSLDEQTRDQGGDLGWFPRGFGWTALQVEEAAFVGAPGQVQGPIKVGETYVVVQTIAYEPEHLLDSEMQELLRATVFDRWLALRRATADIEILVELGPETG